MFLKNLKIDNNNSVVRSVSFHKGFNIIVDETPVDFGDTVSGNNVGKTTVLRLIDFCLGGDGKNIYYDTEFKTKTNTQVEAFLKDNNITVQLTLVEDLDDPDSSEIQIVKNFLSYSKKVQTINGESFTNNQEFLKKLNQLVFKNNHDKPTFRQIISKNIRDEKNKLANTVKILHQTTRLEEYEALYLFWLGIDTDNAKRKEELGRQKNLERRLIERLKKENTLSQITQSLIIVERTISELNVKKENLNFNEDYNSELDKLNLTKSQINQRSTELGRLEIKCDLILESKADLEADIAHIDLRKIETMYERAKSFIPSIQTSFQQVVDFHNEMISEKIKFITKELPSTKQQIESVKSEINTLLSQEKALTKKLRKAGAVNEFQDVITELNRQFEKKGTLEEQKRLWENSNAKIKAIEDELNSINNGIVSNEDLIQARVTEFNRFFSEVSYRLYGERFVLSADKGERAYELNITSLEGNLGTGKKKGQIAAFDLAYVLFADELGIPCLHFILHDQVENIHDNQLNTLAELANEINCQLIIPVLKDKLPDENYYRQFEVLRLSQNDKLFKIA